MKYRSREGDEETTFTMKESEEDAIPSQGKLRIPPVYKDFSSPPHLILASSPPGTLSFHYGSH
jgi:hypothetical protein